MENEKYLIKKVAYLTVKGDFYYEIGKFNEENDCLDSQKIVRGDSLEELAKTCGSILRLSRGATLTTIPAPVIKRTPGIMMDVPISSEELSNFNELYRKTPGFLEATNISFSYDTMATPYGQA